MKKKITVLVYSPFDSVMGRRARGLFQNFQNFSFDIVYRKSTNLIDALRFLGKTLNNKPHIIYMIDSGLPSLITGLFTKILTLSRVKVFLDVGDLPYLMVSKYEDPKYFAPLQKIYELLVYVAEYGCHAVSNAVIVRGHGHIDYLRKRGFKKKIHVVPDGTYPKIFKPKNVDKLRKKLNLDKYLTIGLIGNIYLSEKQETYYGKHVIEALKLLKDIKVKAIIVGGGEGLPKIKEKAKEYGIENNILLTGKINYERINDYYNLMDIFDFSWINIEYTNIYTSAKLPEAMLTGRYIIASDMYEANLLIPKIGNGIVLHYEGENDPGYPKRLAQAIRKVYNNTKLLKNGMKGVKYAEEYYDYKVLSEKLEKIFLSST